MDLHPTSNNLDSIDWEEQWRQFSPAFHDGHAHIDLSQFDSTYQKTLLLKAGGGFGDLSHPTTKICLELMPALVKNMPIIDIGCGSGILLLAALLMGAKNAVGIDIDPIALKHTQINAQLNHLTHLVKTTTQIPKLQQTPHVIFMNMLFFEQKIAWISHKQQIPFNAILITSGILTENQISYLQWAAEQSWQLLHNATNEQWSGFIFQT